MHNYSSRLVAALMYYWAQAKPHYNKM